MVQSPVIYRPITQHPIIQSSRVCEHVRALFFIVSPSNHPLSNHSSSNRPSSIIRSPITNHPSSNHPSSVVQSSRACEVCACVCYSLLCHHPIVHHPTILHPIIHQPSNLPPNHPPSSIAGLGAGRAGAFGKVLGKAGDRGQSGAEAHRCRQEGAMYEEFIS